jgi:N-acyl homoserine lactone hydrolase
VDLLALRCGDLRTDIGALFTGTASGVVDLVPVMAFAVDTGDGVLVFDTGMHEACCGPDPQQHFGLITTIFEMCCPRQAVIDQRLAQAGLAADEIRWVTNSHLHFDHAGGNGLFPDATQLIRARERQYAQQRSTRPSGFLPGDLARIPESAWDYDDRFEVAAGVSLIDAPGHTPGHQALEVRFADGNHFVCVGDAAYELAAIDSLTVTGRPSDRAQSIDTLTSLRAMAHDGVKLLTAHDLDQWRDVADVAVVHHG